MDVLAAATVPKNADKDLMAINLARQRAWDNFHLILCRAYLQ